MIASKESPSVVTAVILWLGVGLLGGAGGPGTATAGELTSTAADSIVVINELHVNPDIKTELVEFIELHNPGTSDVALGGWRLDGGVFYTFEAGTVLSAGGYLVVAEDPIRVRAKWSGRFPVPMTSLFGPYGGHLDSEGERIVLCDAAGDIVDEVNYQVGFPWPTVGDAVPETSPGSGQSMQLTNPWFDNDLGGSWRSALPTPAGLNAGVFSSNIAPQVRQVKHSPKQPQSGEVVVVTAKVTDPNGVAAVTLYYQIVAPGAYISRTDSQYNSNWATATMHDDGLNGDAEMLDGIYTFEMPASVQKHRYLIRYRIRATDATGASVMVPYSDDPQPNFAYFVYDGVPGWKGAARPGDTGALGQVVQYSAETMNSLPVYHLVSKKTDVEAWMWKEQIPYNSTQGTVFKWYGTLVYDGEVYDHIRYRLRGGVWRYAMGKNMPKFTLLRGHYFQARDDYGNKYDTKWDTINFSACIQQGDYQHRGEQGMFEAAAFKFFNLMGCPASRTNWVHFRIVDEAAETGATQYEGDFWGLYMTLEQMDGRFLDEHGLPDGNLYKMDSGAPDAGAGGGSLNNQGPTQPTNHSDLTAFQSGYRARPQEAWWRQNVELPPYYGFRCVVEGVHHGDMEGGKNWFFYHDPVTNRWTILPWDVDLTWANNMYGGGADDFTRNSIFSNANLQIEYQNRQREFFDLFYNKDQAYQVLDDLADIIDSPAGGTATFVGADRAMWDYNPIMTSSYVNQSKAGQGRFYQRASTKDFRGMVQIMKDYIASSNRAFNTYTEDPQAPQTPVVTATGPAGFPLNTLTFRTGPFADAQGAGTFAAMKWRIGEVMAGSQIVVPSQGSGLVLLPDGATWKYFKGLSDPSATQGAWRALSFNDAQWLTGKTAIGYGEDFLATTLNDMRNGYTTVYLRNTFEVASLTSFDKLILEVKLDDGVNVWINGKLAYQENVSSAEVPYNGTAASSIEDTTFRRAELGAPATWLVRGTNVVAVQVLNSSLGSSSDCFLDLRLTGEKTQSGGDGTEEVVTPAAERRPGKYEIEPLWESAELTTFNADVKIPASVVKTGHTYRIRCRMKDTSGRWSHWSAPVQFEAGEPIAAG
ncbi:MAG: CotH kinase family protein, partial [Sedimentisphaerales bacterium]|nr:CotH kinase family protein [Sedimentisphaerales bacterium]